MGIARKGMVVLGSRLHEECGVFGICNATAMPAARAAYLGLFALQHRGQESCGIAVSDMGVISSHKSMGLVGEAFDDAAVEALKGQTAIGHVRYSTAGGSLIENCQPLVFRYAKGRFAVAHNGNLTNARELQEELARNGAMFQTTTDSEVIAHIIAQERTAAVSIEQAVMRAMKRIKGAYSILVMSPRKMIAARDPEGFRPLVIGKLEDAFVAASETCALDAVKATFVRDVQPGEVVVINPEGMSAYTENCTGDRRICIFEYIYFARPDSVIDGISVQDSRIRAGELLAEQHPVEADIVIGVPDSGLDAAMGYADYSGIPYGIGFVRNNYVGRTFIKPSQSERRQSVNIKLAPIPQSINGKRVVVVDDSIVRGSTSASIIHNLKRAGAAQVHVRICSPTIHWPCYFGTDIPTKEELTANHNTVEELCDSIGADSLGFLDKNSLYALIGVERKTFCDACFTGDYPVL